MRNVFTYGSLMFRPVWERVVEGRYRSEPAALQAYLRRRVVGEAYPVILKADDTDTVCGIVYHDVTPDDLRRLDDFEGEQYLRQTVNVHLDNGKRVPANAYIVKKRYRHLVSELEWDPVYFESHGMHDFLNQYRGFWKSDR